ncbi:MAG TPA: adenylate/guanylate cyclase domain-containing protein [Solirubrobacteraceae bacterium]|nr:adenylate/guanylate cyclase domain-containing protein [Solirubrobacteraceae bacterium]
MPVGGVEVDTAVLFADVRGSTSLGESTPPTEFAGLLNRFYEVATDTLVRHDAVIDKLIGDEVRAFFVQGVSGPEYRRKAVEAGTELLSAVGYGTPDGPWLSMGGGERGRRLRRQRGGVRSSISRRSGTPSMSERGCRARRGGELLIREGIGAEPVAEIPRRTLNLRWHQEPIEVLVLTA